jgi:single-stranded-DNA-specific exonuclease
MRITGVDPGKVTTKTIGFVLAPRLNAAGRLDDAMIALELLLAPDMARALPLAQELDALNQKRRDLTSDVREQAREMVISRTSMPSLIFAASPDFPSGVVGLAASRLLDEFYRPSVVVSIEGDYSKGSARSIPEFHITQALDAAADLLVRHGGHAAAAGFTVETARLNELQARLTAIADKSIGDLTLAPTLSVDAAVPMRELSWDLYDRLERLQPFGYGNPTPVFVSRRVRVLSARGVGSDGRHLKLYLADEVGGTWDAIAFRQGYWVGRLTTWIDLAYVLERNEWNGRINLQLNVQDIHTGDEGRSVL